MIKQVVKFTLPRNYLLTQNLGKLIMLTLKQLTVVQHFLT